MKYLCGVFEIMKTACESGSDRHLRVSKISQQEIETR